MTVKNKAEENKKEKADPAPAPNDDLVALLSVTIFYFLRLYILIKLNILLFFSVRRR